MQNELEDVKWERNVLEGHLRTAVKECNNLDSLLSEAEDEADKMVSKIQLLEQQVTVKNYCIPITQVGGRGF
ncbi:hypothetical protein LINPERPRIM_LOCUS26422 [Linum perenne]